MMSYCVKSNPTKYSQRGSLPILQINICFLILGKKLKAKNVKKDASSVSGRIVRKTRKFAQIISFTEVWFGKSDMESLPYQFGWCSGEGGGRRRALFASIRDQGSW